MYRLLVAVLRGGRIVDVRQVDGVYCYGRDLHFGGQTTRMPSHNSRHLQSNGSRVRITRNILSPSETLVRCLCHPLKGSSFVVVHSGHDDQVLVHENSREKLSQDRRFKVISAQKQSNYRLIFSLQHYILSNMTSAVVVRLLCDELQQKETAVTMLPSRGKQIRLHLHSCFISLSLKMSADFLLG